MPRSPGKIVHTVTYEVTGESTGIRLLQKPLRFRAEVKTEAFEDRDAEKVREWALDALRRHAVLEFKPAIEVLLSSCDDHRIPLTPTKPHDEEDAELLAIDAEHRERFGYNSALSIRYRRFYLGVSLSGCREVQWEQYRPDNPTAMGKVIRDLRLFQDEDYYRPDNAAKNFTGDLPYFDRGTHAWRDPNEGDALRAILHYTDATWQAIQAIDETLRNARHRLKDLLGDPPALARLSGPTGTRFGVLTPPARDEAARKP